MVLFFIREQGHLAEQLIELQYKKETSFRKNDMAQVAGLMDDYRHVSSTSTFTCKGTVRRLVLGPVEPKPTLKAGMARLLWTSTDSPRTPSFP